MRCPVCGAENKYGLDNCSICGTDNINPTFVNRADVESWQEDMNFAKGVFFLEENNPSMSLFTEAFRHEAPNRTESQLDIYFGYKALKEKLDNNPNDHISRSWMVDYLVQVYTFPNNYPVSSRKYVRREISHNMSRLLLVREDSVEGRLRHACNKAVLALYNAEVELSDGNVAQCLAHYYEFLTNPVVYKGIMSYNDKSDYIENDADIKFVIHNCKELCTLFSFSEQHVLKKILDRLSDALAFTRNGAFYMHAMNCGIVGPYDSEDNRQFILGTKKDKCTLEQCLFQGKILQSGLSDFGVGCTNSIELSFDEEFNPVWSVEYRTLACDLNKTIERQRYSIENEISKILMLFYI